MAAKAVATHGRNSALRVAVRVEFQDLLALGLGLRLLSSTTPEMIRAIILMLRERTAPRSEVIRAILLADSPCCGGVRTGLAAAASFGGAFATFLATCAAARAPSRNRAIAHRRAAPAPSCTSWSAQANADCPPAALITSGCGLSSSMFGPYGAVATIS